MKKTFSRLLWMFIFFAVGFAVLAWFISYVLQWQFHDEDATFYLKLIFTATLGLICLVGLPILALTLCIRRALPGTRRN